MQLAEDNGLLVNKAVLADDLPEGKDDLVLRPGI